MSDGKDDSSLLTVAIKHVEEDENKSDKPKSKEKYLDKEEFIRPVVIYAVIALFMLFTIGLLTIFDTGTQDFLTNLFQKIDTLNVMFSLVLSAALEQMWNNKRELNLKITMFVEFVLAFMGFMWFFARSFANIMIIHKGLNTSYVFEPFFQNANNMFWFNVLYMFFCTAAIVYGFYVKAIQELD